MKKEELFSVIGEVDEQKVAAAGEAIAKTKKRRSLWLRLGALAACLCLVTAGAFIIHSVLGKTNAGKENVIVVNEAENFMIIDIYAQITYYAPDEEGLVSKFKDITGLNYYKFIKKIPDTYVLGYLYAYDLYDFESDNGQYIPHDFVLNYQHEKSGSVRIAICSIEAPLSDLMYFSDSELQPSVINGVEVYIQSFEHVFAASFTYEDINYDIETKNITLEELENLLVEIIS